MLTIRGYGKKSKSPKDAGEEKPQTHKLSLKGKVREKP